MKTIRSLKPAYPGPVKIAIVGDAPNDEESDLGIPFVGKTGNEFMSILKEAEIERGRCFLSHVFLQQPPGRDIESLCMNKTQVSLAWSEMPMDERKALAEMWGEPKFALDKKYPFPALKQGKYFHPGTLPHVTRLKAELEEIKPNIVIAAGAAACWALLGAGGVKKVRGTTIGAHLIPGLKVMPTYGPATVMKQWDLRAIVLADLKKAKKESEFPEIIRPSREVWIDPTLEDIWKFHDLYMRNASVIACDIETEKGQISCIGFAPDEKHAITIPFLDYRKENRSYWDSPEDEVAAWKYVQLILAGHWIKLFQNGLYDIQYLWKVAKLRLANVTEDTMLLHHSLQPELEKGLAFLGSIYTNEPNWKLAYRKRADTEKRDE